MTNTDIAIIGAGPYGLSLAAYLTKQKANFQIFGIPMEVWRRNMPEGMFLKSEGFACTLFDPDRTFTLERYCKAEGRPYAPIGLPVDRDLFCDYGEAFQRRFAPTLRAVHVTALTRDEKGFVLHLSDNTVCTAGRVIVACGISHFKHIPKELESLPPDRFAHSANLAPLASYKGKTITVLGAGSSAVDAAGLLQQAGAQTEIFTRRPKIWFNNPPERTTSFKRLISHITRPRSGLGLGWRSKIACAAPQLFHIMPSRLRIRVTHGHLGPSATWMSRQLIEGKVPIHTNATLAKTEIQEDRVTLTFARPDGSSFISKTDFVVAGTGYVANVDKLTFLSAEIHAAIRTEAASPILDRNFESSVPGLYFIGLSAANSFGPMLRFAWGARFVAPHLSKHLRKPFRRQ